jgi:glycosyltransferase involved in cell wall biosynthesis
MLAETPVPADIDTIPQPVLGYFGVIDERVDYDLIAAVADANTDANVVMVGPVVKVDPASLPQRSNIHWLGQRDYQSLPGYVKRFDVCLMPFALNEATEFINPTKTLEYMAAGKPIVSTAVPDVVRNFTPIVRVARSQQEFVTMTARAAAAPDDALIAQGLAKARAESWDCIVDQMQRIIAKVTEATTPEPRVAKRFVALGELAVQ